MREGHLVHCQPGVRERQGAVHLTFEGRPMVHSPLAAAARDVLSRLVAAQGFADQVLRARRQLRRCEVRAYPPLARPLFLSSDRGDLLRRGWLDKNLVQFAEQNKQIDILISRRPSRHPVVKAAYVNDTPKVRPTIAPPDRALLDRSPARAGGNAQEHESASDHGEDTRAAQCAQRRLAKVGQDFSHVAERAGPVGTGAEV